jgi:hypothetical protein
VCAIQQQVAEQFLHFTDIQTFDGLVTPIDPEFTKQTDIQSRHSSGLRSWYCHESRKCNTVTLIAGYPLLKQINILPEGSSTPFASEAKESIFAGVYRRPNAGKSVAIDIV